MAESEGEIEYLEEDAEIVQQCVQLVQDPISTKTVPDVVQRRQKRSTSLLVERPRVQKRKKVIKDDDSEYDPSEDELPPSPPSPPVRKRRATRPVKPKIKSKEREAPTIVPIFSGVTYTKPQSLEAPVLSARDEYLKRKKFNIRIPDYEDPLCLPVRAIKAEESDLKRLNNWNHVCLEHFKHCDTMLKPEQGETKSSTRTAVFKNVINKKTGNSETTIWSKSCVENEDGDKKSEIFQCILPRYREKKVPGDYKLVNSKHHPIVKMINEVILCKENHTDGEALVVYKPRESMSAVYGLIDKRNNGEELEEEEAPPAPKGESNLYLQEVAVCKICAPCFQASWRGVTKYKRKPVVCPVCARSYRTISSLLEHLKGHSATDVNDYKRNISQILTNLAGYHYKCRVCRKQFPTIKALRGHVPEHESKETFTCEVCNRVVNEH